MTARGCNEDVVQGWYAISVHRGEIHVEAGEGVGGERGRTADLILTPDEAVTMAQHLMRLAKAARGVA